MSGWQMVCTVAVVVAVIGPVLVAFVVLAGRGSTTTVAPSSSRPVVSAAAGNQAVLAQFLSHSAPDRDFTLPEAWREVSLHRSCCRGDCARKAAAYRVLVAADKVQLAREAWL